MTKNTRQTPTSTRQPDRDILFWLAAAFVPPLLYLPIAAVEGGWGEPVLFWWMCWVMILIVYDNAKQIQHLCAGSQHLKKLVRRASRKGAVISLSVTALITVFVPLLVHVPVPERMYEMPLFLLPFVFNIWQDSLIRRLRKNQNHHHKDHQSINNKTFGHE